MHPRCCRSPAGNIGVHYTTSCYTQFSAPEDGRDHRPKHVELIGIINKPLLLHLVGVYIIYVNDVRSNKYQYFACVLVPLVISHTNVTINGHQTSEIGLSLTSRNIHFLSDGCWVNAFEICHVIKMVFIVELTFHWNGLHPFSVSSSGSTLSTTTLSVFCVGTFSVCYLLYKKTLMMTEGRNM